jgi:DNA-binding beta-propeller fold protein YncE
MNMRRVGALVLGVSCVGLALLAVARADEELGAYKQFVDTIKIPGDLVGGFDIAWVDSEAGRFYLADRGNKSIDVVDTKHNTFLYAIPLHAAGNGVVSIRKSNDDEDELDGPGELWVGDASSFVEVVDLKTKSVVADIPTNGTARADELAYDPLDHIVLIANDRDDPAFVTFISTKTRTVLGTLAYPQVKFGSPATGHGLEQSVWNSKTKKFYLAVPATSTNPKGEIDEIDPLKMTVTEVFPTTCNPAGLVLVQGQRLVTSCGDIFDLKTEMIVTTVAGAGGDEIWYNPGDERVYFGNFFTVPVVDTDTNTLLTTLTVGFSATPFSNSHFTHSLAADRENNRIFVPVTHEGVKVYTDEEDQGAHHD